MQSFISRQREQCKKDIDSLEEENVSREEHTLIITHFPRGELHSPGSGSAHSGPTPKDGPSICVKS